MIMQRTSSRRLLLSLAIALLASLALTITPSHTRAAQAETVSLEPIRALNLPLGVSFGGFDPRTGLMFYFDASASATTLFAYDANGAMKGFTRTTGQSEILVADAGVFLFELTMARVTLLNRDNLAVVRVFPLPEPSISPGVQINGKLWMRHPAAASLIALDLTSGTAQSYSTWGAPLLTRIHGTALVVAGDATLHGFADVLDLSTDPPRQLSHVNFSAPTSFTTDPTSSNQVLGRSMVTTTPSAIAAYSIPNLTRTATTYEPPAAVLAAVAAETNPFGSYWGTQPPEISTNPAGWMATSWGPMPFVLGPGTAAGTTSHELTGPGGVTPAPGVIVPVGWLPSGPTLVARHSMYTNLVYFYTATAFSAPPSTTTPPTTTPPTATPPTTTPPPADSRGEYTPVTPFRLFDSREVPASEPGGGALGPAETVTVPIAGRGPVPLNGVEAVVVNITAMGSSEPTYVTAFPTSGIRPEVSNVNTGPGQLKVNAAFVRLGLNGAISIYNDQGSTPVAIDVQGYFSTSAGPAASRFHTITPRRLLDTRQDGGPVPAGTSRTVTVTGANIPADAKAVMLNVTVINPTATNYIVAYPNGETQPFASNINAEPGQTVPNLIVVKVGTNGTINLGNVGGATDLAVDITGWWDTDRTTNTGRFIPETQPSRWIDTRTQFGPVHQANHYAMNFGAPYRAGYLAGTGALVLNTTVIALDGGGYAQIYPGDLGADPPAASNLNFGTGDTVANLTPSRLGTNDHIDYLAQGSTTHIIMDLQGSFTNQHA